MSHFKIQFETSSSSHGRQRVGAPKPKKPSAPAKLPHITKLMALAIRLEHLLATGQVKDQAEIARTAGITRARVTQIINLTNLAPDIQQAILDLEPTHRPRPPFPRTRSAHHCDRRKLGEATNPLETAYQTSLILHGRIRIEYLK